MAVCIFGDLRQEVRQQLGDAFYREAGHQVDKHQHPHQQREGCRQQKQRGGSGVDRHVQRQVAAQHSGGDLYPTGRFLFHGGSLWGNVCGGVVAGEQYSSADVCGSGKAPGSMTSIDPYIIV